MKIARGLTRANVLGGFEPIAQDRNFLVVDADFQTREARIAELKRQIAAGTYETTEKLEAAIDAFLDTQPAKTDRSEAYRPNRPK